MSLFGKILAILNMFAAVAFLSLATLDYNRRSAWSQGHFHRALLLHGLPVDDKDPGFRQPGEAVVEDLSKGSMRVAFGDPNFPKTQSEAVQAALSELKAKYDAAATPAEKAKIVEMYLVPLQTRVDAREAVRQRARAVKDAAAADALFAELEGEFQRAFSVQRPDGGKRDYSERRRSVADLLVNVDRRPEWRGHVQKVVGIEEYTQAVARQAKNLADMSERYKAMIADERAHFVRQYQAEMPEITSLARKLDEYQAKVDAQKAILATHVTQRNARRDDANGSKDYEKRIETQTKLATEELARLVDLQNRLFALQQEFALTMAANQKLEQEIRAKVQER